MLFRSARAASTAQQEDPLNGVPQEYHDFCNVFSGEKANALPPHRLYDLKINLEEVLRLVPPETERPLGAGRLGLSHWAGPSVTGSAGWSQKWYGGIIVDILAKESKFP